MTIYNIFLTSYIKNCLTRDPEIFKFTVDIQYRRAIFVAILFKRNLEFYFDFFKGWKA